MKVVNTGCEQKFSTKNVFKPVIKFMKNICYLKYRAVGTPPCHSIEKNFACPHCQYRGNNKWNLKSHMSKHCRDTTALSLTVDE